MPSEREKVTWSQSTVEEALGILWAILACVASNEVVRWFAVIMASVCMIAAIALAVRSLLTKGASDEAE